MRMKSMHFVPMPNEGGGRYVTATRHADGIDVEILNDPRKPEIRFTVGAVTARALSQAIADVLPEALAPESN